MPHDDRLDSWKEIASYLRRGVRTAQRWARTAGLPVRHVATERGAVYAFRSEIDAWWERQSASAIHALPRQSQPAEIELRGPTGFRAVSEPPVSQAHSADRVRPFLSPAIDIDPASPDPHADLAVYFFTLVVMGLLRPEDGMQAARASAQRAIDLQPSHATAHALAAIVSAHYDRDWREAERQFGLALTVRPVSPAVRFHYAIWYLSPLRRHDEALDHVADGVLDDPLYLLGRVHVAMELLSLGQADQGLAELDRVLHIDSRFGPALGHLGRELALRAQIEDALALAERTYRAIPRHPNAVGFLAGMLRRTGDRARSNELLESLVRERAWSAPRAYAESHLVCDEVAAAAEWIGRAIGERDPGVWLLFAGTAGNLIRATPYWHALRRQLNMPTP